MSVIYIALPVTLLLAAGFVIAFILAARRGQFDDLDTPAMRILFDDDDSPAHGSSAGDEQPDDAPTRV